MMTSRLARFSILLPCAALLAAATPAAPPASPALRPPTIAIGDGAISGRRLEPYANAWMFSVQRPDGRRVDQGIWSDVLHRREVDGRSLLERIQGMTYSNGLMSSTINRFDPDTMAPVSAEQHTPDGRIVRRSFAGRHVATRYSPSPGAPEQVRETDLPVPVYDFNGGMYGMLLAGMNLRPGDRGILPAIGEFTDDYDTIPFRVVRRETVRAGSRGQVETWVVEVGEPTAMTFWISERAPYIIRLVLPMNGNQASFDMIG
jgi:hypothetical protein